MPGNMGLRLWAYGVRNPQGVALNPWDQTVWLHEHGPRGGDEINIAEKGKNYGWPVASWGKDYSGLPIPERKGGKMAGTEQPVFWWKHSPAVSGMAFYDADRFPQWQHKLFIGALADKSLIQMTINGNRITEDRRLLTGRGKRIRDVRMGPDGCIKWRAAESQPTAALIEYARAYSLTNRDHHGFPTGRTFGLAGVQRSS